MRLTLMQATTRLVLGVLIATTLATPALAEPPSARPEDEKAIRVVIDAFIAAVAKGDAKAIAGLFTEQGEAIGIGGEAIRGREALEAHYGSRFADGPGEKLEVDVELLHFLAPELARQDGRTRLIPPDGGPTSASKYSANFLKTQGAWKIASLRELDDPAVPHHERLKELEWLLGDWIEETGDAVIETTVGWSDDQNFLLRNYAIKIHGKVNLKGTQRIGWDPLTKQLKSWVFDSRGTSGEGHWSRNGDRWIIKSTGVRPDGLTTSATQVLTRLGKDRLLWSSINRTLGGETRDDIDEFLMVRKPPQVK
jgi:uncharacterized protein (TIGR02246 family)